MLDSARHRFSVPHAFACLLGIAACGTAQHDTATLCSDATRIATLPPQLGEASGVVVSRQHPGILWLHNDSEGVPSLYALDATGRLVAEIELTGAASQQDWEDIDVGPCPQGTCLYIGDIGDNYHARDDRAILRFPEPHPGSPEVPVVERFPFRYPAGRRDSEALFVTPDTTVYIISKGRSGPVTVYRYPPPLRAGVTVTLQPVQELTPGLAQLADLVTGASATPDGSRIVVRTYSHLQLYRFDGDTLKALWPSPGFDLIELAEPQGEGVAVTADGTVYLASETGLEERPPPLSRLSCSLASP